MSKKGCGRGNDDATSAPLPESLARKSERRAFVLRVDNYTIEFDDPGIKLLDHTKVSPLTLIKEGEGPVRTEQLTIRKSHCQSERVQS